MKTKGVEEQATEYLGKLERLRQRLPAEDGRVLDEGIYLISVLRGYGKIIDIIEEYGEKRYEDGVHYEQWSNRANP